MSKENQNQEAQAQETQAQETQAQETQAQDAQEVDAQEALSDEMKILLELQGKLEESLKKADEWRNEALRARADLENARRRFDIQSAENKKFASEGTLKAFLPIVDDLDQAILHAESKADKDTALLEGIKLVHRKFLQVCENQGAQSFFPLGEIFDPTLHEALTEMPSADYEPGKIAQVYQRGWKLHDRLLRPAKVIVAKGM